MPSTGRAEYQRIEAETSPINFGDYWTSGQIEGCGENFSIHYCDAASGDYGVDGVDCAGEWIPLEFDLGWPRTIQVLACSAASESFVRQFQIRFLELVGDDYVEVAADTLVTEPGLGFS
jgi:hypothetical protein